ncbi:uncharacterized protein LTR77_000975 [Saxophila tyrrhenica]|uniref:Uncharacterized protein n=1 Tax=Saxophila tyrrhenica TaxID=1690608 RepID=A0AAV9PU08_9PEZI|nr:hypothetical protein LTR77_000975 [Saxophila tyrrhenica]
MPGSPDFPPGGMLSPPVPSAHPMLFLQFETRHSIYDSSEPQGQFIVEASTSHTHGEPLEEIVGRSDSTDVNLAFEITVDDHALISANINTSAGPQLFDFDFASLPPRLKAYEAVLEATLSPHGGDQNFTATTDLYYLPAKNSGSTVKVDNLYGGMLVANDATDYAFKPLLPFGFYTSCSGYLNYSLSNVAAYKDLGFNAINPVCAFTDGNLDYLFDWLDETNVWYQYDMRGSYLNLSSVAEQIPLIKDRSAFLSWYTADEPDGWQYPLNSTRLTYESLKEQDPYHPTGLVLNCDNYHFKEYSTGADYLMEDAYPVGIDPAYSRPWNTTCNTTYGDCGCDNCIGELEDVSNRLDSYRDYQQWLGRWQKPLWSVLQAFHGPYWSRNPTAIETWAMVMLSFSHGAKAVMSWQFPNSDALSEAHAAFAKVATLPPVSTFLLNDNPKSVKTDGNEKLDVSYWMHGDEMMVGIANLERENNQQRVEIGLPFACKGTGSQPWGNVAWKLAESNQSCTLVSANGLEGLATSIVILRMETE